MPKTIKKHIKKKKYEKTIKKRYDKTIKKKKRVKGKARTQRGGRPTAEECRNLRWTDPVGHGWGVNPGSTDVTPIPKRKSIEDGYTGPEKGRCEDYVGTEIGVPQKICCDKDNSPVADETRRNNAAKRAARELEQEKRKEKQYGTKGSIGRTVREGLKIDRESTKSIEDGVEGISNAVSEATKSLQNIGYGNYEERKDECDKFKKLKAGWQETEIRAADEDERREARKELTKLKVSEGNKCSAEELDKLKSSDIKENIRTTFSGVGQSASDALDSASDALNSGLNAVSGVGNSVLGAVSGNENSSETTPVAEVPDSSDTSSVSAKGNDESAEEKKESPKGTDELAEEKKEEETAAELTYVEKEVLRRIGLKTSDDLTFVNGLIAPETITTMYDETKIIHGDDDEGSSDVEEDTTEGGTEAPSNDTSTANGESAKGESKEIEREGDQLGGGLSLSDVGDFITKKTGTKVFEGSRRLESKKMRNIREVSEEIKKRFGEELKNYIAQKNSVKDVIFKLKIDENNNIKNINDFWHFIETGEKRTTFMEEGSALLESAASTVGSAASTVSGLLKKKTR